MVFGITFRHCKKYVIGTITESTSHEILCININSKTTPFGNSNIHPYKINA